MIAFRRRPLLCEDILDLEGGRLGCWCSGIWYHPSRLIGSPMGLWVQHRLRVPTSVSSSCLLLGRCVSRRLGTWCSCVFGRSSLSRCRVCRFYWGISSFYGCLPLISLVFYPKYLPRYVYAGRLLRETYLFKKWGLVMFKNYRFVSIISVVWLEGVLCPLLAIRWLGLSCSCEGDTPMAAVFIWDPSTAHLWL